MPPATKNIPRVAISGGTCRYTDTAALIDARQHADADAAEDRNRPRNAARHEQARDHRTQRVDGPDREVEPAAHQHQRGRARDDEVQRHRSEQVDEVRTARRMRC